MLWICKICASTFFRERSFADTNTDLVVYNLLSEEKKFQSNVSCYWQVQRNILKYYPWISCFFTPLNKNPMMHYWTNARQNVFVKMYLYLLKLSGFSWSMVVNGLLGKLLFSNDLLALLFMLIYSWINFNLSE